MIQLPQSNVDIRNEGSDDSDWDDDDDDFRARKINIRIKPAGQVKDPKISSSVDELRATVDSWKSMANLNHLSKPTSRRSQYQSTAQLNQVDKFLDCQSILDDLMPACNGLTLNNHPFIEHVQFQPQTNLIPRLESQIGNIVTESKPYEALPIAIAIQECLNVKLTSNNNNNLQDFHIATGLKGCVKMAVPPKMLYMILTNSQEKMLMSFNCNFAVNQIWVNESFARRSNNDEMNNQYSPLAAHFQKPNKIPDDQFALNNINNDNSITLAIDTNSIKNYIVERYKNNTEAKYFVLPELFRYDISQQGLTVDQTTSITPILGYSDWLHQANVTKVKIDIEILDQILYHQLFLSDHDVLDLKIVLNYKGTISDYRTKPDTLDIINPNKLVWTFSNLNEFMQKAESNPPYYSCIARLENHQSMVPGLLVDDVELSFKIRNKNVTGTSIKIVNEIGNFKLSLVKSEVRTGVFKIQSVPGI